MAPGPCGVPRHLRLRPTISIKPPQQAHAGRSELHVDLGLDRIFVWRFDDKKGVLAPNDPPSVALPPRDGPRHFRFHPNGRWLYSIQEEGSTVVLFDYDVAAYGGESSHPTAREALRMI